MYIIKSKKETRMLQRNRQPDDSRTRAIRARKKQMPTVEEVLRAAKVDVSDPQMLDYYNKIFTVENKKSAF